MNQQIPKSKQKRSVEAIKKRSGLAHPVKFRPADLTPELRGKIASEDESRLITVTEPHGLGLPLEVVKAIGLGWAIGSASGMPSFQAKEVGHSLNEAEVRRLLHAQCQIKSELIQAVIAAGTAKIGATRRVAQ